MTRTAVASAAVHTSAVRRRNRGTAMVVMTMMAMMTVRTVRTVMAVRTVRTVIAVGTVMAMMVVMMAEMVTSTRGAVMVPVMRSVMRIAGRGRWHMVPRMVMTVVREHGWRRIHRVMLRLHPIRRYTIWRLKRQMGRELKTNTYGRELSRRLFMSLGLIVTFVEYFFLYLERRDGRDRPRVV